MKGNVLKISEFQKALVEQMEDIKRTTDVIFQFPSKEKLNNRPAENKWSVVEHLDHMNSIVRQYFLQMDRSKSTRLKGATYNPRFLGRLFIGFMEPPPKVKLKTFGIFEPQIMDLSEVEQEFHNLRKEFVERLNNAVENYTLRSKLSSPLSNLLKFEFGEAFMILTAHDRRHIYSIDNIYQSIIDL